MICSVCSLWGVALVALGGCLLVNPVKPLNFWFCFDWIAAAMGRMQNSVQNSRPSPLPKIGSFEFISPKKFVILRERGSDPAPPGGDAGVKSVHEPAGCLFFWPSHDPITNCSFVQSGPSKCCSASALLKSCCNWGQLWLDMRTNRFFLEDPGGGP